MNYLARFTLSLLFSIVIASPAWAAGRMFYDGFESGTFNATWQQTFVLGPGTIPASDNKGHDNLVLPISGHRMMECGYLGNQDFWFCESLPIDTMYTDEVFIRLWMRYDQDVQSDQGSMEHVLRFYDNSQGGATGIYSAGLTGPQFFTDGFWHNTRPSGTPQYLNYSPAPGNNQWHKYEHYLNNATHVYKMWIDGSVVVNVSGSMIDWHFPTYIPLHNWGSPTPTDDNTHIYFDEVEVYSDLGTGGSGLMSDASITQGSSSSYVVLSGSVKVTGVMRVP